MNKKDHISIFEEYYTEQAFIDQFKKDPKRGVDVIIPIMHTNELWHNNLTSYYREIPINRLLLGDGGVIDDSLEIAKKFPRVEILDHTEFTSLGYSIRRLIEAVETEWFIYLHSDVYLPKGWFDSMEKFKGKFDWYQCRQQLTVQVEYDPYTHAEYAARAFSGSQMGRKDAFNAVLPQIDDDYLYRNEDIILANLLEREGLKYGHVDDTFHYHQQLFKKSKWERKLERVVLHPIMSPEEDLRANMTFIKGIIKYLTPTPALTKQVINCGRRMYKSNQISEEELISWTKITNPIWVKYLPSEHRILYKINDTLRTSFKRLLKLLKL